jgi:hypothetical protein
MAPFNEWHEGHQFEPMMDLEQLTAEERAVGYHNSPDGGYRLEALRNCSPTWSVRAKLLLPPLPFPLSVET